MNKIIKENIVKNIAIIVLLLFLFNPVRNSIANVTDTNLNTLSLIISILILGSMFGNFAFTYDHSKLNSSHNRYLSHFVTGILMFTMGLLFEFAIAVTFNLGVGLLFLPVMILIYVAMIGYDFWDLLRELKN